MAKEKTIPASEIAGYLKADLIGADIAISGVASYKKVQKGKVSFIANLLFDEDKNIGALFIVPLDKDVNDPSANSYIQVKNPRLAYAQMVEKFFYEKQKTGIAATAFIASDAAIGKNCMIGEYAVIEEAAAIGENTVIGHHAVIGKHCLIGSNCIINAGAVIGSEGLGSIRNEDNVPVMTRHVGRVVIQDNVEIGANSTIQRGTIDDTFIEANVKTSPQVNIGHNCIIGKNTEIASGTQICGSAVIGEGCFLGVNCLIKEGVVVGKNSTIGLGAIVIRNVDDNQIISGLESLPLRNLIRFKNQHGYK